MRGFFLHRGPASPAGPCFLRLLLLVVLLTALQPAGNLHAQELMSWWNRGLVPLDLEPGSWACFERQAVAEGQVSTDTLCCHVLLAPSDGSRWLSLESASDPREILLHMHPDSLAGGRSVLSSILEVYRRSEDGQWLAQDSASWKDSHLVSRHFEDPFQEPVIRNAAVVDTLIDGITLSMQSIGLEEERARRTIIGDRTLVHSIRLQARALVSSAIPVFGILNVSMRTELASRWEGGSAKRPSPRSAPPVISLVDLRCLRFGNDGPQSLPGSFPGGRQ